MTLLSTLYTTSPTNSFSTVWQANFSEVPYIPSGTPNDYQTFNMYLPDATQHPVPAAGYPCVVRINLTDYTASAKDDDVINDPEGYAILEAGLALCDATVTFTTAGGSVTGGGLFWDPTDANWGSDDTAEQDVIWIIQKLRDLDTEMFVDPDGIGLYGAANGAAGTVCAWVACEADHADSGAGTTQEQQSSVPSACVAIKPAAWYPGMIQSTAQDHLRDEGTPANQATTIGDASSDHQQQASPVYRIKQAGRVDVPMLFRSSDASSGSADLRIGRRFPESATGIERLPAISGKLSALSDAWHQIMLMHYLRNHTSDNLFHRGQSTLWTSQSAQRPSFDRVVSDAGDDLTPHLLAFFHATLTAWGEVDTWDVPYTYHHQVDTKRDGVRSDGAVVHGRQIRTGSSRHRLTASARGWRIGHSAITDAQADQLRTIDTNAIGNVKPIAFDAPDAPGKVPVFAVADSLNLVHRNGEVWSYSITLEEAI